MSFGLGSQLFARDFTELREMQSINRLESQLSSARLDNSIVVEQLNQSRANAAKLAAEVEELHVMVDGLVSMLAAASVVDVVALKEHVDRTVQASRAAAAQQREQRACSRCRAMVHVRQTYQTDFGTLCAGCYRASQDAP